MVTREEKSRRMEIRKSTGSRPRLSEETMRHAGLIPKIKGPDYLVAHACFECRVSFKRKLSDKRVLCSHCSTPLREMGRSFKAPKKADTEQWKKVQALWEAGFRFPTNSWKQRVVTPYPEKYKDVEEFIRQNPNHPFRIKR